jgi:hypothetical protein
VLYPTVQGVPPLLLVYLYLVDLRCELGFVCGWTLSSRTSWLPLNLRGHFLGVFHLTSGRVFTGSLP